MESTRILFWCSLSSFILMMGALLFYVINECKKNSRLTPEEREDIKRKTMNHQNNMRDRLFENNYRLERIEIERQQKEINDRIESKRLRNNRNLLKNNSIIESKEDKEKDLSDLSPLVVSSIY